jgi:hypothetical protein
LLAVANTAEMRGAGGMILSFGVLTSTNGTISLGHFGRIDELELDSAVDPGSLGLPADFLTRWNGLEPTRLWRNTTLAPSFPLAAPTMCAMFRAKTDARCDGVIQVDPDGLAAIVRGIGPVDVDPVGTVTAADVVDLTLNRAYVSFPERDQRQDVLGDVAKAVFSRLMSGSYPSVRPLAEAVYDAVQERHIMFWSDKVTAEQPAAFFDGTGALPAADQLDHLMLTVQNFSKNKLDYYLDTSVQLVGDRPSAAIGRVTATITLGNTAPVNGLSSYVFGGDLPGQRPGVYEGIVSLYLPNGTSLVGAGGDDMTRPAALTTEAGRTLVTFGMDVPASAARTVTLDLALPPRPRNVPYRFALVPVPRVRPTMVGVNLRLDGESSLVRQNAPLVRPENLGETRTTP